MTKMWEKQNLYLGKMSLEAFRMEVTARKRYYMDHPITERIPEESLEMFYQTEAKYHSNVNGLM